jgi:hypothetical protein
LRRLEVDLTGQVPERGRCPLVRAEAWVFEQADGVWHTVSQHREPADCDGDKSATRVKPFGVFTVHDRSFVLTDQHYWEHVEYGSRAAGCIDTMKERHEPDVGGQVSLARFAVGPRWVLQSHLVPQFTSDTQPFAGTEAVNPVGPVRILESSGGRPIASHEVPYAARDHTALYARDARVHRDA